MDVTRKYGQIDEFISSGESVLVLGPRGSGKTFFLEKIVKSKKNYHIVNLLESEQFIKFSKNPERLAQTGEQARERGRLLKPVARALSWLGSFVTSLEHGPKGA